MLSKKIMIRNHIGLHARPAAMIANEALKLHSQVLLRNGHLAADAKNSARVLALAVNCGDCVELMVSGDDEADALQAMSRVFDLINSSNC